MTKRVAIALLERFVPDCEGLTGDLLEDFERRHSSLSLWWQVLAALAASRLQRDPEIRPLHLVDLQPVDAVQRARQWHARFERVNLSASPVAGVGGLGLVALASYVTVLVPGTWWLLAASVLTGVVLGIALIAVRANAPQAPGSILAR